MDHTKILPYSFYFIFCSFSTTCNELNTFLVYTKKIRGLLIFYNLMIMDIVDDLRHVCLESLNVQNTMLCFRQKFIFSQYLKISNETEPLIRCEKNSTWNYTELELYSSDYSKFFESCSEYFTVNAISF
jgi:hypothetical protein